VGPASTSPDERYAALADTLLESSGANVGIAGKKGFGSSSLTIGGKIFAMLVNGRLVVKLPRDRVDALVTSGDGERFDPGHGRVMKEWLSLEPTSQEDWLALAREAMTFVATKH
jgi:TfoX/Sxy family transcriptional regulator of competence genes